MSRLLLPRLFAIPVATMMVLAFNQQAKAAPDLAPESRPSPSAKPVLPKDATAVPDSWIVQVSGAATAEGGSANEAVQSQDRVLGEASNEGLAVQRTASYTSIYNGMTVTGSSSDADRLREITGVLAVWPVLRIGAPKAAATSEKGLTSALAMTGADSAYSEFGLTGKGIRVGVIDTGLDFDHPDLGGTGTTGTTTFPSARVNWGHDFVGDSYDPAGSTDEQTKPKPDDIPDDCNGHGTHVAGIIGAAGSFETGGVRGVAPEVSFGAYRVFGCDGGTSTDIVLAAMDKAIADHMDVVNMSFGETYMSWPSYPTSVAARTMQKAGVILVSGAGNEGGDGTFTTSTPSVSDAAISVAAVENVSIPAHSFTTTTGSTVPYLASLGAAPAPTTGSAELALAGLDGDGGENTACTQIAPLVTGKVAVINRGVCGFREKAIAAQNAGAVAVVLINNIPGLSSITVAGDPEITIPVVLVPATDGAALTAALHTGSVSLTWTSEWVTTANPAGGLVSDSSSYGLAADLSLKPDLGAPGGNILSTYPVEKGSYATDSGTSMASPHVAGAVALLLQSKPWLKGKTTQVRELLQTTGTLAAWSQDPTSAALEPVHHQGGGLIQIITALTTQQTASPGKISFGDGSANARTATITVTNTSKLPVTYKISKSDGVATLGSLLTDDFFQTATATMSAPKTVTVPAGGKTKVTIRIKPPASPKTAIYGGWITFTAEGATTLHVPFAGMVGSYQSVKVLSGDGLPSLAQPDSEGNLLPVSGTTEYSMQNFDYPFVMLHLDYPVSELRVDIYRVGWWGRSIPIAPNYKSWIQISPAGKDSEYRYYYFDGDYKMSGKKGHQYPIENGRYVITITVTKALSSGHNRSGRETWTSPVFTIRKSV